MEEESFKRGIEFWIKKRQVKQRSFGMVHAYMQDNRAGISIIAAMSRNRVIGVENRLPWNIPEELAYFYRMIQGKVVIVGHRTYIAMHKSIPGAVQVVVLSRDLNLRLTGAIVAHSVDQALQLCQGCSSEIMVIGGATVYAQLLPIAERLYLTMIHRWVVGDSYFPAWSSQNWQLIDQHDAASAGYTYSFTTWQRNSHQFSGKTQ